MDYCKVFSSAQMTLQGYGIEKHRITSPPYPPTISVPGISIQSCWTTNKKIKWLKCLAYNDWMHITICIYPAIRRDFCPSRMTLNN